MNARLGLLALLPFPRPLGRRMLSRLVTRRLVVIPGTGPGNMPGNMPMPSMAKLLVIGGRFQLPGSTMRVTREIRPAAWVAPMAPREPLKAPWNVPPW